MKDTVDRKSSAYMINWKRAVSCYKYSFLEILALRINYFYKLLISWRKPVYLKEIKMANISKKDRVLHIGSGILPYAPMLIAETTNAKVISIEYNKKALKLAQHFINKKGLSNQITIEYGDGIKYSIKGFDVIFIAINVWPIDKVLRHIHKQMKENAKVICKSFKNDIKTALNQKDLKDKFLIKSMLKNPKSSTYLLIKK